uniref:Uncharacterized protein n=1 Tax=Anguilla anguilla TaxID=7936 RepID=A0A0E9PTL7_ANGAN
MLWWKGGCDATNTSRDATSNSSLSLAHPAIGGNAEREKQPENNTAQHKGKHNRKKNKDKKTVHGHVR